MDVRSRVQLGLADESLLGFKLSGLWASQLPATIPAAVIHTNSTTNPEAPMRIDNACIGSSTLVVNNTCLEPARTCYLYIYIYTSFSISQ